MALSLQPYNYSVLKPDYYLFITDNGDEYECNFLSNENYFSKYPEVASKKFAFNLGLNNPPLRKRGVDMRIAATVIEIVAEFLLSKINAVVYVCDPANEKGAARARKFKSWFNYYEHPSHKIIQVNADMDAGGITLHTALLVHRDNRLKQRFIEAFLELTSGQKE
jgi:hypothetical protein